MNQNGFLNKIIEECQNNESKAIKILIARGFLIEALLVRISNVWQ